MGIELVNLLLLRHASRLSGRAFKVLCRMASIALDQPNAKGQPARLYFAGEEPLAAVLYGPSGSYTANQLREVRRVLRELADAGLIERKTGAAHRGTRQSFELRIGLGLEGESAHPNEGEIAHPIEGEIAPQRVGNLPTPRTHTGTSEDSTKDATPSPAALTTGRARGNVPEIRIDPVAPHLYAPDAYDVACEVCDLPASHNRHRRIA